MYLHKKLDSNSDSKPNAIRKLLFNFEIQSNSQNKTNFTFLQDKLPENFDIHKSHTPQNYTKPGCYTPDHQTQIRNSMLSNGVSLLPYKSTPQQMCLTKEQKIFSPSNSSEIDTNISEEKFYERQATSHITGKQILIKHLNLENFKKFECPRKLVTHNHKSCYYYHSFRDRRRQQDLYTPELCKFAETERCPKKSKCKRAHNRVERLYHKDKYKTKFCHQSQTQQCEYGEYCSFAHLVEDIQVRLIHYIQPGKDKQDFDFYMFYFKTEWCPFNHEHNKAQCVYAHNFQDFRRRPDLFCYDVSLCEDWQSGTFITSYEEGCKNLQTCKFAHGWKEQQFHPLVYKTIQCDQGSKCFKGYECPFYHTAKDHRVIDPELQKYAEALVKNNFSSVKLETHIVRSMHEEIFKPVPREFSCKEQPKMASLRFKNNMNHGTNTDKPKQEIFRDLSSDSESSYQQKLQKLAFEILQEN